MKEALVQLGRLPRAAVRPPLAKLDRAEVARIREALIESGFVDEMTSSSAA
jgi:4-hydroxy-tetrahydrodipicolinate synthase